MGPSWLVWAPRMEASGSQNLEHGLETALESPEYSLEMALVRPDAKTNPMMRMRMRTRMRMRMVRMMKASKTLHVVVRAVGILGNSLPRGPEAGTSQSIVKSLSANAGGTPPTQGQNYNINWAILCCCASVVWGASKNPPRSGLLKKAVQTPDLAQGVVP